MSFPQLRPLAALSLLIAMGAVAAPPERGSHERGHPSRSGQSGKLPPQRPAPPMPSPGPHRPAHAPMAADAPMATHFHSVQRQAAQAWFDEPEHRGFVPPGLAKKGGLPPGQARLWKRGQPLPAGVIGYALPRSLELVLGPPPAGHRYVRVATDILLIAIGTGIVVDALEDIAR